MANNTVGIDVVDDAVSPQPIEGVIIQFYTDLGVFSTSGTTDGDGNATVSLPDGIYNLMFYKQGVSILPRQPQQIIVSSLAASNDFSVTGHIRTLPEALDPLRCRISGSILGVDGLPTQDLRISFRPCPDFSVVGGNLVSIQSQVEVSADTSGYFQFDLLRGIKYLAYMRGIDTFPQLGITPASLLIIPPDQASLELVNLLFPLPVAVNFSNLTISIPLAAGLDGSATLGTILYSDGSSSGTDVNSRTQLPPFTGLNYVYSDPTLFSIILSNGVTQITPFKTGTGTVSLTRTIPQSVYWPIPPSFVSQTLTITIT